VQYTVQVTEVTEQPIAAVRGRATMANLPATIRQLFDRFYAGFKGKGGLNIVLYTDPGVAGEFEIACGVQLERVQPEHDANASSPAGTVATTVYMGPYDQMKPAHEAIHKWARENGRRLTGPSWEVYGHWSDDPAKLRTDIFYLLA
jgi:effector-binding domain-containing protein